MDDATRNDLEALAGFVTAQRMVLAHLVSAQMATHADPLKATDDYIDSLYDALRLDGAATDENQRIRGHLLSHLEILFRDVRTTLRGWRDASGQA